MQPNTFQFCQSVSAVTKVSTTLGTHRFPANHTVRIRGYRSDGKMAAETSFPGEKRLREFSFPIEDLEKIEIDMLALKEQLNGVTVCVSEQHPMVLDLKSLAESLGN